MNYAEIAQNQRLLPLSTRGGVDSTRSRRSNNLATERVTRDLGFGAGSCQNVAQTDKFPESIASD